MEVLNKIKPLLCIGDLVVDIFSSPMEQIPEPGECVMTNEISIFPGGNALNIALATHKLGDSVSIYGEIGNDALGQILLNQLKERGIDTSFIKTIEGNLTSSTIIFRSLAEDRRFIHNLGVGYNFTGKELTVDQIPENGVVVIGGYLKLFNWKDDYLFEYLQKVKEKGNTILLSITYLKNSGVDLKRCLTLLKYVDVFVPNEDEAREITDESDTLNQAQILRKSGANMVIITRGSKGIYAENSELSVKLDGFKVSTVDPSGCGDCFTAGLIATLRRGFDFVKILKFGSALGALSSTALGCTTGVPKFEEVESFLLKNSISEEVKRLNE